jgi:Zn-dependent alcohol dehydrogenase
LTWKTTSWSYPKKCGADSVINGKKEEVGRTVRKLTKIGSDFVIEAAGTTHTVEQPPLLVRKQAKSPSSANLRVT